MSQFQENNIVDYQSFVEICLSLGVSNILYIQLSYPVYVAQKTGNLDAMEKSILTRKLNIHLQNTGRLS